MVSYLLVITTGIVFSLVCAVFAKRFSIGRSLFSVPSIPLVFFFIFISMQVLGNLLLFKPLAIAPLLSERWLALYLENLSFTSMGAWRTIFALNLVLVGVTVGIGLGLRICRFKPELEVQRYLSVSLREDPLAIVRIFIVFSIMAIAVSLIYFALGGGFPLIDWMRTFLNTGSWEVARKTFYAERLALTYSEAGRLLGQGYFEQFRCVLLPYAVGFLLFYTLRYRRSKALRWYVRALFAAAIFLLIASGQYSPLLYFFIALFVTFGYLPRSFFSKRTAMILGIAIFLLAMIPLLIRGSLQDIASSVLLERILLGNAVDTRQAFELFPGKFTFQYGRTWLISLSSLLPGSSGGFGVKFYQMVYGGTGVGSTSASVAGEFYINFGFTGVIIGSIFIGLMLQLFHIFFIRLSHKSLLDVVSLGFMGTMLALAWALGNLLSFVPLGTAGIFLWWMIVKLAIHGRKGEHPIKSRG